MSRNVDKLVQMIRVHIPDMPAKGWTVRRTYCGWLQKSHGAFSFYIIWAGDGNIPDEAVPYNNLIGSQYTVAELVKHGVEDVTNRYGDLHINPKGT